MKVRGLRLDQVEQALKDTSHEDYDGNLKFKREPEWNGNWIHFTITVKDSSGKGARRSPSGRKVSAACWHAHRDLMVHIFDENPDAILVTALARYDGKDDFNVKYPRTAHYNIGSIANPCPIEFACEC